MIQEMCYMNGNGERKLCTVFAYIKYFLSIVEIENTKCHRCSQLKTPVNLVAEKLIMSIDELHTYNLPRQNDHQKYTVLENDTVVLDAIFQKYFQKSFLKDVICEFFSSGSYESI